MGVVYPPPERLSPEAKTHALYVSKNERLLVRIYNWQQALGYSILVRFIDKNGIERYVRRDGATRDTVYVDNIYIELEEGYLTGVNVYTIYYPGGAYQPFYALIAITHGRTPIEEVSTCLAYGVVGYSAPLSWPYQQFHQVEDYVDAYTLSYGDVNATSWSWSPPGESEVAYIYLKVTLGSGTGTRLLNVKTSYATYDTASATVTMDVPSASYDVIISHTREPGTLGRTMYINLPTLRHLRYMENVSASISGAQTGDKIVNYAMRYIRLPWVRWW